MVCHSCRDEHSADNLCDTQRHLRTEVDPLVGTEIGSFQIVQLIGRGGMGTVYLGEHRVIGSKVAIKVLHPQLSLDPQMVARFRAEARATNRIGHENIVSIYDFGTLGDPVRYYMVMENLTGEPLSTRAGTPMPVGEVVEILHQVLGALGAAHRAGVVHRDLKPENIFLVRRLRPFVKVLDFGIAKLFADETSAKTAADAILGTPEFMSPEQVDGGAIDGRADLYALGVIAYQLLSGKLPFTGGWAKVMLAHQTEAPPPLAELAPSVPRPLCEVVMRALEKKPARRFASAEAFAEALRGAMGSPSGIRLHSEPPAPTAGSTPRGTIVASADLLREVEVARAGRKTPVRLKPPAPAPSPKVTYRARLSAFSGGAERDVSVTDLSRVGALVQTAGTLPALRERLRLRIALPGGTLEVKGEVVQHLLPEQAQAWGLSAGFAVQFVDPASQLPRLLSNAPVKTSPEVETLFRDFRRRLTGGHYAMLELPEDADFGAIRRRARESLERLEAASALPMSAEEREQLQKLIDRVNEARLVLADPPRRAEYDASISNPAGVARCIAHGLTVTELEACRRRFLATRKNVEGKTHVRLKAGRAWEAEDKPLEAIREYEQALRDDPLLLELHQRLAAVRRRLQKTAAA